MRSYHRLLHQPHHNHPLSLLYTAATVRTFVLSFVILFLPVVLYEGFRSLGYVSQTSFVLMGIIYIFLPVFQMIFSFAAAFLNSKFGIKNGFILGQVLFVIFIIVASFSKSLGGNIAGFVLWGMASGFWWVSYHSFFIEAGEKKKFGKQISIIEILGIVAGLAGPVVTGYIMMRFGPAYLFPVAAFITLLSIGCFIGVEEKKKLDSVSVNDIVHEIRLRPRDFLSYLGAGGEEIIYSVAWSMFLYLVFKNYAIVGIFTSLTITVSIIFAFFIGKWTDKMSKDRIEELGASVISGSWIFRAIIQNPILMFLSDAIYKVFLSCFLIPFRAISYKHALEDNINKYVVFREIGYGLGNIIAICVFIIVAYLQLPLWYTFLLGGFLSLIPLLIREKDYV